MSGAGRGSPPEMYPPRRVPAGRVDHPRRNANLMARGTSSPPLRVVNLVCRLLQTFVARETERTTRLARSREVSSGGEPSTSVRRRVRATETAPPFREEMPDPLACGLVSRGLLVDFCKAAMLIGGHEHGKGHPRSPVGPRITEQLVLMIKGSMAQSPTFRIARRKGVYAWRSVIRTLTGYSRRACELPRGRKSPVTCPLADEFVFRMVHARKTS